MVSPFSLRVCSTAVCLLVYLSCATAQETKRTIKEDKFRQLEEILPTPSSTRTGSGSPGPRYWQQRADYVIHVELDDENQRIIGSEKITYKNNSPHTLRYVWLQLDPNLFRPDSDSVVTQTAPSISEKTSPELLKRYLHRMTFNGGVNITSVKGSEGKKLNYKIVKTIMRVDLPKPLKSGQSFAFSVDWNYRINNARVVRGRTGYEYFPEDKNYLYLIAQWYPRLAAYTDVTGWQHKQYLGRGEFTLELGDYEVHITAPEDHIVGSTGVLQNPKQVLTAKQMARLEKAKTAKKPVFIVDEKEAKENFKSKPKKKKTWIFKAKNVRDFAFATSRRFIWDAQGYKHNGGTVMAMSLYPPEGEPLWSKYSTKAIIHTIKHYSKYTFNYPYPVAISVNGPVGGMEYPMICFNGPRPRKGKYSKYTKYALISVIIHEVGHNYFPMIVNSDERQWTWMDEGINTFLQYMSEREWEEKYPSIRGNPKNIVRYMTSTNQVPIMTNSDSILQFGPNAYAKPATALVILRQTVLGPELFDFAFKEYARRWRFKRPMPADFFRTMEDASGVDLDWFWRGWFYSTDHVDIAITDVRAFTKDTKKKSVAQATPKTKPQAAKVADEKQLVVAVKKGKAPESPKEVYERELHGLDAKEREELLSKSHFYIVDFENVGGIVMPIILKLNFEDGTSRTVRIPATIWRRNSEQVSKLIAVSKAIKSFQLDPNQEIADADEANNYYPPRIVPSRFSRFRDSDSSSNKSRKRRPVVPSKGQK
ncbi:MAG: M1 family metallopeptidase [Gemmataceae bacterium]